MPVNLVILLIVLVKRRITRYWHSLIRSLEGKVLLLSVSLLVFSFWALRLKIKNTDTPRNKTNRDKKEVNLWVIVLSAAHINDIKEMCCGNKTNTQRYFPKVIVFSLPLHTNLEERMGETKTITFQSKCWC